MSKHPGRNGRPGGRPGSARRSPQAQALRRRRARRLWWITAGAAAAAVAATAVVIAVTAGGRSATAGGAPAAGAPPAVGAPAPDGSFTTVSGKTGTIASLRGHKALLWFVATWCPSCQAGTHAMAAGLARLRAAGVQVVEVEDYADLGQPGPAMAAFGRQFAGAAYHDPGWTFGTASPALTRAYNPRGYLDIYYLLGSSGRVAYINSATASTMSQLLAHAGKLR